ncbi:TadE family protein [Rosistilla oblonga]|uniref:TadE family protein n=1 Tax=Rosistilla oblonga TaxID=2527990 RepID=UPI003A984AD6
MRFPNRTQTKPADLQSSRRRSPRHAVAAIELAIALPMLMLFTLACADLGRVIHLKVALSNATRVAAEYGAMRKVTSINRDEWTAGIQQAFASDLQATAAFADIETTVQADTEEGELGLYRVRVESQCEFVPAVDWPGLPSSIDLQASVVMLQLR